MTISDSSGTAATVAADEVYANLTGAGQIEQRALSIHSGRRISVAGDVSITVEVAKVGRDGRVAFAETNLRVVAIPIQ